MANVGHGKKFEIMKEKLLEKAKVEFFTNGYKSTKIADVCDKAGVDNNAVARVFCDKESLFLSVIEQVIKDQNKIVKKLLGSTKDNLLEYLMQYVMLLSLAKESDQSCENFTVYYEKKKIKEDKRLYDKLQEDLSNMSKQDFYVCLVALNGIMSKFISLPCVSFSIKDKAEKFICFALSLLNIEKQRAQQIIDFLSGNFSKIQSQSHDFFEQIIKN